MILDKNLPDKKKAEKLVQELERMMKERKAFEGTWTEAQALVSSVILSFDVREGSSTDGYNVPKRITNRPANYQETLVSGLCGYGVNPGIKWLELGLEDEEAMAGYGVKDWLEKIQLAAYNEFDGRNLYGEWKNVIEQATTFGFGVMHVAEDDSRNEVRYKQIDVPEIFLDTNEYNEYETVFRRFFMTVENAVSRFGLEAMNEGIRDRWNLPNNENEKAREIQILHAVFRRKNKKGAFSSRNTDMPFASFFVDVEERHLIEESGYRSFPYAIFVWDKAGGKKYPLSPAIKAINDVKLLTKTEDTRLTLAQMAAKNPIAMPESMRGINEIFGNDGYIRPGAIYYYDEAKGHDVPAGINMGGNYPITLDITQQQADNIKDWFFVDFFLMLQRQNIHNMTATAVQALQSEKATVMTNMIVNLKKALQVVVEITYDLMAMQGRMPELPFSLIRRRKGSGLKFVFSSVLSQVQQQLLRYQGTTQFLPVAEKIANLGQVYPPAMEALDRFDFDVLLQNEARAAHVPETVIREDEDVEAIRAQRAQALAARDEMEQAKQDQLTLAQNYNKLNEAPKPGSPAEALFGRQAG